MSVETLFIVAFILLITEAFVPSLGLIGLGGFIAFVMGVTIMIMDGQSEFYGLSIESVIALGTLIFFAFALFGYFALKSFKKKISTGIEYMQGQSATVKSWNGTSGFIIFEGEDWRAISDMTLNEGDIVIITGYNKLTLTVTKDA
jgi:membrane-bound serine protease (ClpP class)